MSMNTRIIHAIIPLTLLFVAYRLDGQINVDKRSLEPHAWFDTLYTNCQSKQKSLNQEDINSLLQKT